MVANAAVGVLVSGGQTHSATTSKTGSYEIGNLPPGNYTVTANAQGFAVFIQNDVNVAAGQVAQFNIALEINVQQEKVNVQAEGPTLDVNPANNASAIVMTGKDLDALPDDPDELQADLEALAGPSAGPNGGQLYIDGFTAGQLPPKSSIREIRINQNPFSAEYDKLGYGRIEIFTKPGTDKLHGQFSIVGNDSAFNTRNPFLGDAPQASYDSVIYQGNVGGPINKKTSFFVDAQRRNIDEIAVVDAPIGISSGGEEITDNASVPNPRTRTNIGPRIDYQVSPNNTLTTRYQYYRDTWRNDGVGGFVLPEAGYDTTSTEHTVQITDTQVIGTKVINESHFQYLRDNSNQNPVSNPLITLPPGFTRDAAINVLGGFTGGRSSAGSQVDHQDHYELQNYTSVIHGNHTTKFGGRLRALHDDNSTSAGFNGAFTFSSLAEFQGAQCAALASPPPACAGLPSATPKQLAITQGSEFAKLTAYDVGLYFQDDWKVRPNITFSYGLRFESQNDIRDHLDFAPRLGLAWGVGGRSHPPIVVIRGGMGIFYDRFQETQIMQAYLLNGVTQTEYIINNPTCFPGLDQPLTTAIANCGSNTRTVYQISPSLYSPYTLQSAISVERQVTKAATLSVTYLNSRGFDQLLSINANAPYPGTPCYPNCPPPINNENLYQYVSEGVFRQNQVIVNTNIRAGTKLQLFGYYTLNYANSDTAGVTSFASNSYDISQDYGRASFDTRHRLFFGGSVALPYAFRLSPFMIVSSGTPFNIAVADDLNGDSIFNDRPVFVSNAACPGLGTVTGTTYCTPLGTFDDALPSAGQKVVPINYGTGPAHFVMNLRLTRTFGFGPKLKGPAGNLGQNQGGPPPGGGGRGGGGGGPRGGPLFGSGPQMGGGGSDRRYTLTLGVSARNAFNNVNLANPSGILTSTPQGTVSRFFDTPNTLQTGPFSTGTAVRRIDLIATFNF